MLARKIFCRNAREENFLHRVVAVARPWKGARNTHAFDVRDFLPRWETMKFLQIERGAKRALLAFRRPREEGLGIA